MIRQTRTVITKDMKELDYKPSHSGLIDIHNTHKMSVGTLPNVFTSDHVTNNIIKKGAKIFLPKGISVQRYTPKKNLPSINRMIEAGILQKTKHKPLHTTATFCCS